MADRVARFKFSVDIDELIAKARRGEEVLLKLGSAGTNMGKQVQVGADQASQSLGRTGEAATAAAVRFQTLTQGALNLSTAAVQSYTSISNLARAQNDATGAAINHQRAIATLHTMETRLAKIRADSTPDLNRIALLEEKIGIQKQDIARKAESVAIAQDRVNDTYLLFGSSIANTVISSLQTIKTMKDLNAAATLRETFAINANTAALSGNTSALAINTGFLSKYVFAVGPATAGTRALTFANNQLAFSIRGVQIALGPIGLAMIGIGAAWAAYESNIGGVKDALHDFLGIQDKAMSAAEDYSIDIDAVTESYKKMNDQVDKNTSKLEENLKTIRKVMNEGLEGYARGQTTVAGTIAALNARYSLHPSSGGVPALPSNGVPEENIPETQPEDLDLPPWIPQAYGEKQPNAKNKILKYELENGQFRQKSGGGQEFITNSPQIGKSGTYTQDMFGNVTFTPIGVYNPRNIDNRVTEEKFMEQAKVIVSEMNRLANGIMFRKYDPTWEFKSPEDAEKRFWNLYGQLQFMEGNWSAPRGTRLGLSSVGSGAFVAPEGGGMWSPTYYEPTLKRRMLRENMRLKRMGLERNEDNMDFIRGMMDQEKEDATNMQQRAMSDPIFRREFIKMAFGMDIGAVAGSLPFSDAMRIATLESNIASFNGGRGGFDIASNLLGGNATRAFQVPRNTGSYVRALSGGGFKVVQGRGGGIGTPMHLMIAAAEADRVENERRRMQKNPFGLSKTSGRVQRTISNLLAPVPAWMVGHLGNDRSVALNNAQRVRAQWDALLSVFEEAGITPSTGPTVSMRGGKGNSVLYYSSTAEENFAQSYAQAQEILRQRYDVAYGTPLGMSRSQVRSIYFDPMRGTNELDDRIRFMQRQSSMTTGTTL